MKNKIAIAVLTLFSVFASSHVMAQCLAETFSKACIPKLSEGFLFLKNYKIDNEGGVKEKVEYSYVFTKGTQYMINLCTAGENAGGIVIHLLNSDRNQIASSKINGQTVSAISYPCQATGIYYIQYTFELAGQNCGGSALGFKK
jgi:hypothetical protein